MQICRSRDSSDSRRFEFGNRRAHFRQRNVVLEKQTGMREVHSQPITPDHCHAMQQLFRELNERGQPLMLTTPRGPAEALTIFCVQANGRGVDWTGAALTSEQIQHLAYDLIAERQK